MVTVSALGSSRLNVFYDDDKIGHNENHAQALRMAYAAVKASR